MLTEILTSIFPIVFALWMFPKVLLLVPLLAPLGAGPTQGYLINGHYVNITPIY